MSKALSLHIISFDIPYPPDYGGVIDVYYKLKALNEEGVRIMLHCFEYGRKPANELGRLADQVFYYKRNTAKSLLFNTLPYIVLTRNAAELKKNLLKDDHPILMEGLHSTFLLNDPDLGERFKIVRTHNVEHDYYHHLARSEKHIFKRYYFFNEAGKLQKYESVLKKAGAIAAISPSDTAHYMHSFSGVHYIPAFHPFEEVKSKTGRGEYAFYHGNLSVAENNEAALFLVEKVFNDLPFPLVIAGSRPSGELQRAVKSSTNITLRDDLSHKEMLKMIGDAQCNVLPTFQSTGIKLKLLASLFCGRACVVNTPMVLNTGLESLCHIADTPEKMKEAVRLAMETGFQQEEIERRKEILKKDFSNSNNAKKLVQIAG